MEGVVGVLTIGFPLVAILWLLVGQMRRQVRDPWAQLDADDRPGRR